MTYTSVVAEPDLGLKLGLKLILEGVLDSAVGAVKAESKESTM